MEVILPCIYQSSLERGQVLPASTLNNSVDVELIYQGVKYPVQVNKMGTSNYLLVLNNSVKEAEVHRLKDGEYSRTLRSKVERLNFFCGVMGAGKNSHRFFSCAVKCKINRFLLFIVFFIINYCLLFKETNESRLKDEFLFTAKGKMFKWLHLMTACRKEEGWVLCSEVQCVHFLIKYFTALWKLNVESCGAIYGESNKHLLEWR